jgi:hypothetical protein
LPTEENDEVEATKDLKSPSRRKRVKPWLRKFASYYFQRLHGQFNQSPKDL